MFETLGLAGLLLPLGIAIGWVAARGRSTSAPPSASARSAASSLARGVRHLVEDDPDQAIAHFLRMIEVDDDTVETHLMLGRLLRKRGEVDRALRIHENLAARPNLAPEHRDEARFELGLSYARAGVLDRAEALLLELVEEGRFLAESLEALIGICEQQHDHARAIAFAERLQAVTGTSQGRRIAYYRCEQAAELIEQDPRRARRLCEQALRTDPTCVRASLLAARACLALDDVKGALANWRRVLDQDPRFIGEVLEDAERACRQAGDLDAWVEFLADAEAVAPGVEPVVARARLMLEAGMDAGAHLRAALARRPGWSAARLLSELPVSEQSLRAVLRELCDRQLAARPRYRCDHCGLTPRLMFWQCPGCRNWGTVAPVPDLIDARARSS